MVPAFWSHSRASDLARSGAIVTLGSCHKARDRLRVYPKAKGDSGAIGGGAYPVSAFVEKPDLDKAKQYLPEVTILERGDLRGHGRKYPAGNENSICPGSTGV